MFATATKPRTSLSMIVLQRLSDANMNKSPAFHCDIPRQTSVHADGDASTRSILYVSPHATTDDGGVIGSGGISRFFGIVKMKMKSKGRDRLSI